MNWIGVVFFSALGLLLGIIGQKFVEFVAQARAHTGAEEILDHARDKAETIRDDQSHGEQSLSDYEDQLVRKNEKISTRIEQHQQRIEALNERIESRRTMAKKHRIQIESDQDQISQLKDKHNELRSKLLNRLEEKADESQENVVKRLAKELKSQSKLTASRMISGHEHAVETRQDQIARHILGSVIPRCDIVNPTKVSSAVLKFPDAEAYEVFHEFFNDHREEIIELIDTDVRFEPEDQLAVVETLEPVPREIAFRTLNNLIQQKKFYFEMIEEGVDRYRRQVENEQKRAARESMNFCEIDQVPDRMFELLGVLQFRTSYGQHQLTHSMEVAYLGDLMAREVGANAELTRRAGLLHDIGKAIDRQRDKGHAVIGAEIAEEEGEDPIIVNGIGSHHGDMEPNSVESVLVAAADAISGSRPGARRENVTNYSERIESLLDLAKDRKGVKKVYAMNAGRELRIRVNRRQIGDKDMEKLARSIAQDIEEELTYSGEIKINTIRETKITRTAQRKN